MPRDGYDRDRSSTENNVRGRIWENGTDRYFHDHERGYTKPSRERELPTKSGKYRRYDKQRGTLEDGPVRAIEDKSGAIGGRKDERQLRRDYELIKDGKVEHLLLRSVVGEPISPMARQWIDKLSRDFPDKFTHQMVPRDEAREVWAIGRQLERGHQLELPGVGELAREQVRERKDPGRRQAFLKALVASTELAKQRHRHREQVRDQVREIEAHASTNSPLDPNPLEKKHERLSKRLETIREAERRHERNLLKALGLRLSEDQMRAVEQLREEDREKNRKDVVAGLGVIGHEVERRHWRQITDQHNARVRQLGIEHLRSVERHYSGRSNYERETAIEQAQRQVTRLLLTPEKTAGLHLERFRAVHEGQETGYDPMSKAFLYQRPSRLPIQVENDAPERRIARMLQDVDRGLSVDQVLTRQALGDGAAEPASEATRRGHLHALPTSRERSREPERERERGVDRGPEHRR